MTLRETTISKLQNLPDPLLQQVSDYIDAISQDQQNENTIAQAWSQWFEDVDRLEANSVQEIDGYQTLLLDKYRQQGLSL